MNALIEISGHFYLDYVLSSELKSNFNKANNVSILLVNSDLLKI